MKRKIKRCGKAACRSRPRCRGQEGGAGLGPKCRLTIVPVDVAVPFNVEWWIVLRARSFSLSVAVGLDYVTIVCMILVIIVVDIVVERIEL
jgi:hypothetical protein